MDAYCYALSVIKKLGYICDTLSYLIDYQQGLFSRRSSKVQGEPREQREQSQIYLNYAESRSRSTNVKCNAKFT